MRLLVAALALAGCTTGEVPIGAPARCLTDASVGAGFVGKAFSLALAEQFRVRAGARSVRVIRPGQAVTMDYREDRLNIELDAGDLVTGGRCG